jgi:hypothetical protein
MISQGGTRGLLNIPFVAICFLLVFLAGVSTSSAQRGGNAQQQNATPFCGFCRTEINGQYRVYETTPRKTLICAACELKTPTCSICRIPHKPNELRKERETELWCRDCLKRHKRCDACQEPIIGRNYSLKNTPGIWCAACFESTSKCYFCAKPAGEGSTPLDMHSTSCKSCSMFAIKGKAAYEKIIDEIHPQIEAQLGRTFKPIPLQVVTPEQMVALGHRLPTTTRKEETVAAAQKPAFLEPINPPAIKREAQGNNMGFYYNFNGERGIVLLDNLPEDKAWETISHELTHAWQDEHFPGNRDFYLVEGFAQFIARRICMQNYKSTRLDAIAERADDYGHAYRVVRLFHDEQGMEAVFKALEAREMPEAFRTNVSVPFTEETEFRGTIVIH